MGTSISGLAEKLAADYMRHEWKPLEALSEPS
jgi:hypothetical protein